MERAGCPRAMLYGKHKRIWELDYFRGVCVLLMIVYHAMYDLRSFSYVWQLRDQDFYPLYQLSVRFFLAPGLHLQDFLAPVFFFIAGISTSLSRNAPVRFTKVIVSAFLVTYCSALMNLNITLGVLHCLGYCMLLYYLLERLFYDDRAYFALAVTLCAAMLIRRSCGLDRMISPLGRSGFPLGTGACAGICGADLPNSCGLLPVIALVRNLSAGRAVRPERLSARESLAPAKRAPAAVRAGRMDRQARALDLSSASALTVRDI